MRVNFTGRAPGLMGDVRADHASDVVLPAPADAVARQSALIHPMFASQLLIGEQKLCTLVPSGQPSGKCRMKLLFRSIAFAASVLGSVSVAQGGVRTVVVDGTANPFLANQPSHTTCCGGDRVDAESPVRVHRRFTGGETLTFKTTGGAGFQPGPLAPTADGFANQLFDMTADYGTGISGPLHVFPAGLVGVFTTDTPSSGKAPPQLDSGTMVATLLPGLNQIFWIGDGLTKTGKGERQKFIAPAGATRLYLGVADGFQWSNNPGQIAVTIHIRRPIATVLADHSRQ